MLDFLKRGTKVLMLVSVHQYEAGKLYRLPVELADQYIAKSYAQGHLSRVYTADELGQLRANGQVVSFSG